MNSKRLHDFLIGQMIFVVILSVIILPLNAQPLGSSFGNQTNRENFKSQPEPKLYPGSVMCTIEIGGLLRRYVLHVPTSYDKSKPAALILSFHGGGMSAAKSEAQTSLSPLSEQEGFIVVYPDGIDNRWNSGQFDPNVFGPVPDDLAFVDALLVKLNQDYAIDPDRMYAVGYSNGGAFVHCLAKSRPGLFRAYGFVAAAVFDNLITNYTFDPSASAFFIYGTKDDLYYGREKPSSRGQILRTLQASGISSADATRMVESYVKNTRTHAEPVISKWVAGTGSKILPVREDMPDLDPSDGCKCVSYSYYDLDDYKRVEFIVVEGGTHYIWARREGGRPIGTPHDFNLNEKLWSFFCASKPLVR